MGRTGTLEHASRGRAATVRAAAALVAWALCAAPAAAQCTIQGAQPMTFTGYVPWGPGSSATADIRYQCVGPSRGRRPSLSISSPRIMAGPNQLGFELYPQGSATPFPESPPLAVAWSGRSRVTVTGALWAPQEAAPGVYQATLLVTLYVDGIAVDSAGLVVSAAIAKTCAIYPATLAFGIYDPLGPNATAPRTARTQIDIQCTRTTSYWVTLDGGGNYGARRQMGNGAGSWLGYDLYSDSALTAAWLPGATPPGMPATAASIARIGIPVYGQIPPAQPAPRGTYQDLVLSTIHF